MLIISISDWFNLKSAFSFLTDQQLITGFVVYSQRPLRPKVWWTNLKKNYKICIKFKILKCFKFSLDKYKMLDFIIKNCDSNVKTFLEFPWLLNNTWKKITIVEFIRKLQKCKF